MNAFVVVAVEGAEDAVELFLAGQKSHQIRRGVWVVSMNATAEDLIDAIATMKGSQGDVAVFEITQARGTVGMSIGNIF